MAKLISELLRRVPADDAPLFAWPAVCGPAVARLTRPLLFVAGRLRVEVPDAGWRDQLSQLEPRYLREFELLLGKDNNVQYLEFVLPRDGS